MDVPELAPDDPLLRRFHPTRGVTVDENTGEKRLNWSALDFRGDGCSVYREHMLGQLGLDRTAILVKHYTSLAASTKADVERHEFANGDEVMHLFSAKESPRTDEPAEEADPAHALIYYHPNELSGGQRRKAEKSLAATFAIVLDEAG